jgi:hypothetical protein
MQRRRLRATSLRAEAVIAALLLSTAVACDDDGGGKSVTCGEGTTEEDGMCIVDEDEGDDDAGVTPSGDGGTTTATACGTGTIESGGMCIPDPDKVVSCGTGTELKMGKCVPKPVQANINDLKVTHLALRTQGSVLDGTAGRDTVTQYYPIELSVGVTYKGDAAKIPLQINLTKPDSSMPSIGCALGGIELDHPGGTAATEAIATIKAYVPRTCLNAGEGSRTVTPLILIDPDRKLNAVDEDKVSRAVPFHASNKTDTDLAGCRRDADGTTMGTCSLELKVTNSPGLDFELASLKTESSVVVVDKCGTTAPRTLTEDEWKAWLQTFLTGQDVPSDLDVKRPQTYRCNSSIVPEFAIKKKKDAGGKDVPDLDSLGRTQYVLDADSNPTVATVVIDNVTYPSFLYGEADLALNATVIAHGQPNSDVTEFSQANTMFGGKTDPVSHNALAENSLQIKYTIRPNSSNAEADWRPLYLHAKGEQAKADEMTTSGQDKTSPEETTIVPSTPSYYSHGLYLENDCGEKNKAPGQCTPSLNPRDDVIYGAWKDESDFTVRACLVPLNDAGGADNTVDKDPSNNCKDVQVRLVRRPTSGATKSASSYDFNKDWSNTQGNTSTIALVTNIFTHNHLDTSGATTDNQASLSVVSGLVGSIDIIRGWGKAAGYVSLVGSYYDYGISVFGYKFWGESKQIAEYHWDRDFKMSKEQSWSFRVWAGIIPISISLRLYGEVGLLIGLDIIAIGDGADADAIADADGQPADTDGNTDAAILAKFSESGKYVVNRIGLAVATAKPYGLMKATASAGIDVLIARAGVAGELTLIDLQTPLRGYLAWGAISLTPVTLRASVWADFVLKLTVLSGRVYIYLEHWEVYGCGSWCVTSGYRTFWDYTIASWSGWGWNQTLWSWPGTKYDVKL